MSLLSADNLDFYKKKFVKDGLWLGVSQVILAISGILINIILTQQYGASGFGIFSIGLKVYLILSLLAVFGCGSSVIKHVSQYKDNQREVDQIISSALILSLIASSMVAIMAYFLSPSLLHLFGLTNHQILLYFLPGIPLFTMNKVLLGVLNGKRKIKHLSILQSLRWALILLLVLVAILLNKVEIQQIAIVFPISEAILFPFCWWSARNEFTFSFSPVKNWYRKNVVFGGQVMFSSAIIDLYTYTDVFMIGIFMNTKAVGIYAFASDICKNLLSLANLIQINLNPIISELWHKGEVVKLKNHIRRVRKTTHLIYIPIVLLAVFGYVLFVTHFMGEEFNASILPFIILSGGVFLLSGFKAIYSLPELTGYPGDNLLINFTILLVNILLNYVLLQIWSLDGVALATCISYFTSVVLLYALVKKRLSINIFN